jgi:cytochrome b subunit of formate dehydrogenase
MTTTHGSAGRTGGPMRRPDAERSDEKRSGAERSEAPQWVPRFTGAERWVHHGTAALLLACVATAAMLYVGPLAVAVGRRELIKTLHLLAGFALPMPILLGWLSAAFRADLRRLNRFRPADWEWLRRDDRRAVHRGRGVLDVGKFNAGQKLNAAFVGGSICVMLGTGAMLTFPDPWPDSLRTGATFVHDWLTLAIVAVVLGHLWYALRDPQSLRGIWTGEVRRDWAARDHPAWLDEHEANERAEATEPAARRTREPANEPVARTNTEVEAPKSGA